MSDFAAQGRRVAVYGAAFDPPHRGHMDVVEQLLAGFDAVLLVPAASHAFGKDMAPFAQRARMLRLALAEQGLDGRRVSISELEQQMLRAQGGRGPMYTYAVLCRLREQAAAAGLQESYVFAVGPDNAAPETWARFWQAERISAEFGVFVVEERVHLHSTDCRARIRECYQEPAGCFARLHPWLGPGVSDYIERHRLYAIVTSNLLPHPGPEPTRESMPPPCQERKPTPLRPVMEGEPPRSWIVPSSHPYQPWEDALPGVLRLADQPQEADYIVVVGGDGAMLHSIQEYSWADKPFVGLNAGTRGFLMNEVADAESLEQLFNSVYVEDLWMVEADVLTDDGLHRVYGFNDIWVERTHGQTLKMRVTVDGVRHPALIVGDGMLFSTPQGSTGYNQALRGKVLLPEVPVLQMTPMSCVVNKAPFGSLLFCYNSEICLDFEEQDKRPARLFYDGIRFHKGPVRSFTVRKSGRTVRLGFDDRNALKTRVIGWQFQY